MSYRYSGKDNLVLMKMARNYNRAIYKWLLKGVSKQSFLLEFGAGAGEFCNRFNGYNITAVELDEDMHTYINCKTYKCLTDLDTTFDMVYAVNVLEHITNDRAIIRQFSTLLNHKGKVKILVPARNELFSSMDELVGHKRRYSMETLCDLFSSSDLLIQSCRYFDFIGYFVSLFYKALNRSGAFNKQTILLFDRFIFPLSRLIDKITCGRLIGKNIILEARKE